MRRSFCFSARQSCRAAMAAPMTPADTVPAMTNTESNFEILFILFPHAEPKYLTVVNESA